MRPLRNPTSFAILVTAVVVIILFCIKKYSETETSTNAQTNYVSSKPGYEHSHEEKVPLIIRGAYPAGVCDTYKELRDVNFFHKSLRDKICKDKLAYTIFDSAFPLCQLQQKLPALIVDKVKSKSFRSYIESPLTQRNVSCFVYSNSDIISDSIRNGHFFEKNNVLQMLKIIQHFNSRSPVTFVDIGSNIGAFTLPALDVGVPVVALDANIRNLMRIKLSAESAGFSQKLELLWNFVSSSVSLMYLNFPLDCNVGGATKFGRAITDTIPVMSTTADAVAISIYTKTVIMKVDIEGGEGAFFQSATDLFKTFDIPVVHMEWLERHMTDDERKFMIDFFLSRKYSARSMNDFNRNINIGDPKLSIEDLVWIREDVLKSGSFVV